MKQNVNIFKKAFIEATLSSVFFVISILVVYSLFEHSLPNLFILGLTAFASFYLIKLFLYKIQQKTTNE